MERCTERSFGGYGILKSGYTNEFALCKLATYEDTGLTPEEIKNDIRVFTDMWEEKVSSIKADLEYQKALADAWESNAQSGSNLAHKYRELLLKAREELKAYKDAEEQGLLVRIDCEGCIHDVTYDERGWESSNCKVCGKYMYSQFIDFYESEQ